LPTTGLVYIVAFFVFLLCGIVIDSAWLVYLYEIHYFLNPQNRWWGSFLPNFINSFWISFFLIATYTINRKSYLESKLLYVPQTKWLLSLLCLMLLTGLYAVWPAKHWEYLVYHIKLLAVMAIVYKVIDSNEKFERMLFFYLFGIFYLGVVAYSVGRNGYGRVEGIGMVDGFNANDTAAVMTTAIPILIFYFIKGRRWQRGLSLFALAFVLNGLILINSRGAFLAIIVSTLYLLIAAILSGQIQVKERRQLSFGLVLGSVLFLYLADQTFWNRMITLRTISDQATQGEEVGRIYYWLKTFELLRAYPFGTGACGYQYLSPTFLPQYMLTQGLDGVTHQRAVHSTYFQVLAEYGYLGFALFIGLIASNFRSLRRMRLYFADTDNGWLYCQALSLEAAFISFLTASIFIDRFYSVILYWLILLNAIFYNIYYRSKPPT